MRLCSAFSSLCALTALAAAPSPSYAQTTARPPAADVAQAAATSELVVTGRGEIRAQPDRAAIEIVVETRAVEAATAAAENARRVQLTLDTLARLGVRGPGAISSTSYGIQPEYKSEGGGRSPSLAGYVARNGIRVRLEDLTRIGRVIDAAVAGGANRIGSVRFSISTEPQLQLDALRAAVAQARQRAEVMASAAGGRLGALEQLTTERSEAGPGIQYARVAAELGGGTVGYSEARPETQVGPSELAVVVIVVGRWRFVAAP